MGFYSIEMMGNGIAILIAINLNLRMLLHEFVKILFEFLEFGFFCFHGGEIMRFGGELVKILIE